MASFLKGNQTATTCCHFQKLATPFFVWLVHTEAIKKLSKAVRIKLSQVAPAWLVAQ